MTYNDYKKVEKLVKKKTEKLKELNQKKQDLEDDIHNLETERLKIVYISRDDYTRSFNNNYSLDIKDFLLQKIRKKVGKVSKEIQETEIFIHNIKLQLK